MRLPLIAAAVVLAAALLIAPRPGQCSEITILPAASGTTTDRLVIASVTDMAEIRPLIEAFQKHSPGTAVVYRQSVSDELDAVATKACKEDRFLADFILSSAVAQQVRLVNDGCAQKLRVPAVGRLPDWAKWRGELVGLTLEAAVIVYNKQALAPSDVPHSRFDLVDLLRRTDRFKGKIGTFDIAVSGLGYLFDFEDAAQASTWGRLLESFGRNDVQLFCCTSDILDRVADGRLLIGYNVLGSYALAREEVDPRIGIVFPSDYLLSLSRAGFIPNAALNAPAARRFIAFALSPEGVAILEKTRLLSPIDGESVLSGIAGDGDKTIRPIALSPALLVALDKAKREMFLVQWRRSVGKAKYSALP
ncbi:MAG TPA: ABC transporter substrate-binding protein [Pararhizobium sp.]|nr:ABC transporter substrate-binding protein [Pararhizobium sp.]